VSLHACAFRDGARLIGVVQTVQDTNFPGSPSPAATLAPGHQCDAPCRRAHETVCSDSLRGQVERVLKMADLVLRVVSRRRHSRTHPFVHASSQQGSFPRPSCVASAVIGSTTPSATLLASGYFPGLTGYRVPRSCRRRAREGFSSSAAHLLYVPLSLPRRVLRGCISKRLTSSMAFAVTLAARLPLVPSSRRVQSRGGKIRHTLRTVQLLPPVGLSKCRFDAERFPSMCISAKVTGGVGAK
jgi:hypothetical protein